MICMLMTVGVSLDAPCLNDFVATHGVVHTYFLGCSMGWFLPVFMAT